MQRTGLADPLLRNQRRRRQLPRRHNPNMSASASTAKPPLPLPGPQCPLLLLPVATAVGPGGAGLSPGRPVPEPLIVMVTEREPVPDALVALTRTLMDPAVVGLPLINPVAFIDKPAGKVLDEKVLDELVLVAAIW